MHNSEGGMLLKKERIWTVVSLVACIASFGIATTLGFLKPYTNWDMMAYVGSAVSWQEKDPAIIHQKTLQDVQQGVSHRWRKEIAETTARSSRPDYFAQNLPFYTTKPMYVAVVWLMHATGATGTYAAATWVVAAIFFAGLFILLLLWKPENISRAIWLAILAAFCWFGNRPLSALARFSTPDSMSLFSIFGAFLALFRWRRPRLGIALILAALLIRPETVILAVMMAALFFVMEPSQSPTTKLQSAIMGISAIIIYFSVQGFFGGYGYEKFFYYTYLSGIPNPAEVQVHLTLNDYLQTTLWGLKNIASDSRLLPFLFLSAAAGLIHFLRRPAQSIYPWLLLLAWGHYIVRFLLLPSWQEYRFYSINYILILIASCEMIALQWRNKRVATQGNTAE
jgi:hypothetical protein